MSHPATLERHSPAWVFQVWAAFVLAFATTLVGILYLPVEGWIRAFLWTGEAFLVTSSFALAKTVRDNHEAEKLVNRLSDAKTEKLLREFEKEA